MISLQEIQARHAQRRSWSLHNVEQDMLLGRLVVEIADDSYLAGALVLKGGTCLHKLWLPEPWRYSKDLDYERTEDAPWVRSSTSCEPPGCEQVSRRNPARARGSCCRMSSTGARSLTERE